MSLFGGGSKSAAKTPTQALGIDFQGAQYGPPIPVVYGQNKVAGNCIWYGEFQAIAVQQKQSGGKGGGGSSSTTSYDYKASYQLGLCEGPGSIVNVYNGTSTVSLSSLGAVSSTGTQGQAPWSHLTGGPALGYSGTVLVSFPNRDLGSSASLPNDNFEVAGLCQFGSGIVDANPADILTDICTNAYHGINFGQLGSLTQYSNYCVASGIFLSPVYDQQQTAQQTLSDLLKYTNADAWFSEGVLKVGCYGDQTITGNGVTYTPNITAVADLGPDDFITNGTEAPVTITRKSPADAMNIERLEYVDRANTYHTSAVTATIDNDVVKSGARSDQSDTFHGITTATVGRLVVQNILQRAYYVRNQYAFQLSWRYCYLEPFDIVSLTDVNTGLQSFPVRLLSVEEDNHGLLKLTAEEFPLGIGHGGTYATQPNGGATVDPNSDPGPVAGPYLFRGPGFLVSNNTPEIWCAVTGNGNPLWAGCDVYLSHDGSSYTFLSTYARQSRYGELTNSMAVHTDPDTASAPNVVLNGYNTQLLGGSQADADKFTTLAMIDNEIVSYETATLASGPSYTLSYLRRGGYGSTIAAHSAGAPFVRLDDGILRIPVDPSQIGETIYIKFLSRNCFGRTPRTLAGETAYTYVVGTNVELPDVPNVPDNFAVLPIADGVNVTWTNDNPAAVGCTSIEFSTASGGTYTVLAQEGPTTTSFHHAFTSGATYYYRARARGPLPQSGWSAYTSIVSSTGVNVTGTGGLSDTIANNSAALINPQFNGWGANGSTYGWTVDSGTWAHQSGTNGPLSGTSSYAYRTGSSGTPNDAIRNTANFPVYPGAMVKASCLIRGTGSPNGTCQVRVSWRDATLAELSVTHGSAVTGNTTATSSVSAPAPSGAVIARIEADAIGHTTGAYAVDNFTASSTADSMDQVPDGTTRYGSVQTPTAQLITAALAQASQTPGANMIYNPLFQLGNAGYQQFDAAWITQSANPVYGPDVAIPLNGTALTAAILTNKIPVTAGGALSVAFDYVIQATMTAGDFSADVAWYNSAGTLISRSARLVTDSGASPGGTMIHIASAGLTVPSGIVSAAVRVFIESATGSGFVLVRRLKAELGSTCTPFNDDTTQAGNLLTVAGSGQQLGNQLNNKPIAAAALASAYVSSGGALSETYNSSDHTYSVTMAAFTLQVGSAALSYNSWTSPHLTAATKYYFTLSDPTWAGGSPTLLYSTSQSANLNNDGNISVGFYTTGASGGGGGGSGGGGGGGGCVALSAYLLPNVPASRAKVGMMLDGAADFKLQGRVTVTSVQFFTGPCLMITAADGCSVPVTAATPFTLPDGTTKLASDMLGELVLTDLSPVGGSKVASVESIGSQPYALITRQGNESFAAGVESGKRIYSHNSIK